MSKSVDKWCQLPGLRLRYRIYPAGKPGQKRKNAPKARARVLILPGFTEFIEKHETTCAQFGAMGLESVILDWPGQGRSTRLAGSRIGRAPHLIHCDSFEQHLDGLSAVAKATGYLDEKRRLPLFLFGHSMGGHLALRYAAERAPACKGVILTSPMILPPSTPPGLALMMAEILCNFGFSRSPVMFRNPVIRDSNFLAANKLTRDPAGYAVQPDWWERDARLLAYGASFGWVRAAYSSCLATTANKTWMRDFPLPVQAHLAGDERIVHAKSSRRLLPLISGAEIHDYPEARHELLLELAGVRTALWNRISSFVNLQLI
jgi:lysophospholipase